LDPIFKKLKNTSLHGIKQSHTIDILYVMIASPFVPLGRNGEKPLFGVNLSIYHLNMITFVKTLA